MTRWNNAPQTEGAATLIEELRPYPINRNDVHYLRTELDRVIASEPYWPGVYINQDLLARIISALSEQLKGEG